METTLTEERVLFNINPKNVPFVISALESEVEHLKKIQKTCIKKKQIKAANDLDPGIEPLEHMIKYLKTSKPVPWPLETPATNMLEKVDQ